VNTGQHILLVVFWVVFGMTHSLMALGGVKRKAEKVMGAYFKWYRPIYSLVALVQTGLIFLYLFSIESIQLWQAGSGMQGLFVLCGMAGLVIMGVSIRKYFFRLSGIQALYKKQQGQVLEKEGLHEYVRHPLYGGTLLVAWSVFFLFPFLGFLITCLCMTIYTLIGIRLEEKKLEDLFGQQYKSYKNNVPMIIPFTKFGRLSKPASDKLS
jgi:protein-S-isoprenylcysteine O-methyltransferase Ste14